MNLVVDVPNNAISYIDKLANEQGVTRDIVVRQALILLEDEVRMNGVDALSHMDF